MSNTFSRRRKNSLICPFPPFLSTLLPNIIHPITCPGTRWEPEKAEATTLLSQFEYDRSTIVRKVEKLSSSLRCRMDRGHVYGERLRQSVCYTTPIGRSLINNHFLLISTEGRIQIMRIAYVYASVTKKNSQIPTMSETI